jgi:hypothetical protein
MGALHKFCRDEGSIAEQGMGVQVDHNVIICRKKV